MKSPWSAMLRALREEGHPRRAVRLLDVSAVHHAMDHGFQYAGMQA